VIKVNMFGVRQSRLLVVEHPEAGSNVRGGAAVPRRAAPRRALAAAPTPRPLARSPR
jgi:hypothetical protein